MMRGTCPHQTGKARITVSFCSMFSTAAASAWRQVSSSILLAREFIVVVIEVFVRIRLFRLDVEKIGVQVFGSVFRQWPSYSPRNRRRPEAAGRGQPTITLPTAWCCRTKKSNVISLLFQRCSCLFLLVLFFNKQRGEENYFFVPSLMI